jgi:phosphoribosylformimino-5-aminoimidazole carboxamide ribotide isomerase
MPYFTIFPAIDLRHGEVVRLREGDPNQQKTYSQNPGEVANSWITAGTTWLHVVNLDGAFGESDFANQYALQVILDVTRNTGVQIQFGGGLRSRNAIDIALSLGVDRVVLGTLAIEEPETISTLVTRYGPDRIAVSLDARNGYVQIRGWKADSALLAVDVAQELHRQGLEWLVYTDIARDGIQSGLNLPATVSLAQISQLNVIASGGVGSWEDISGARSSGLAGVIVGKALYEGTFEPAELFRFGNRPATQPDDHE